MENEPIIEVIREEPKKEIEDEKTESAKIEIVDEDTLEAEKEEHQEKREVHHEHGKKKKEIVINIKKQHVEYLAVGAGAFILGVLTQIVLF